ncbi:hypothetical protein F7725_017944 [Dissostichus mawsoni]|uniref:Uncharacterized protein n=1 Tax=Dissostichus mawsoni TaxID=36200 RepID=A0A7J5XRP0_DISMA|nr:hypothetical protein F7725_017944 [Dissostichus mawsoni]
MRGGSSLHLCCSRPPATTSCPAVGLTDCHQTAGEAEGSGHPRTSTEPQGRDSVDREERTECRERRQRTERGDNSGQKDCAAALGGWAVSGQWNRTDFNSTLSLLMRDYATFPFFNLYTLRPFLASCQRYLALLGAPPSSSMPHVGTFISLSSELAVAAAPLQHRLASGRLYERITLRELQDDHVLLHNSLYIQQMSRIISKWLKKHEPSTSSPVHTFMVLNLLHTLMPALDSRFSDTENNLQRRSFKISSPPSSPNYMNSIGQTRSLSVQSKTPRLWTTNETSTESVIDQRFSEVTVDTRGFFSNYVQLLSVAKETKSTPDRAGGGG